MLIDRFSGFVTKAISLLLIITTQSMVATLSYAQDEMNTAVVDANKFSKMLLDQRQTPNFNSNGELIINGKPLFTKETLTGQKENDYIPSTTDGYGNDARVLQEAQAAKNKYEEKDLSTATTAGERAYHIVKKSMETQKPDLTNDPIWKNTDNVFNNLEDIAKGFANCKLESKDVLVNSNQYHVPDYKTCEKLPIQTENFSIAHEYEVGVVKYEAGPVNINTCGEGCVRVWVGTVGDNYWSGWCSIFEEDMSIKIIQPSQITHATLERSKYDDYHQVWLNNKKIYNGPNAEFPPEVGTRCELSTSWNVYPNINLINEFQGVSPGTVMNFKTRTSVAGGGEGYSVIKIHYNYNNLVYNDVWQPKEDIQKALDIYKRAKDGFCKASVTCADMPTLDDKGCTTINGTKVCESNFANNPLAEAGISPFCRKVKVSSDCGFNEGQFCSTNLDGVEECVNNTTVDRNTCKKYENDPTCSYIKTECVGGAEGDSGACYVQEDTYDCGFDASSGSTSTEDVLTCDGKIQCIGESCYSPTRDEANQDFGKANAYLEVLKFAQADMKCEGVPERPFDPESPPDRYTPVPSCATGFTYDSQSDTCLKANHCAYDDANFYAAGSRNGIQIVSSGAVIANDKSVPTCVPFSKGGQTYTCGHTKKKVATDTFYEVCTNDTGPKIPNGCPDPAHNLNPNTGYCEVPPQGMCPEGYNFQEGNMPFDKEDDLCIAPPIATTGECPTGSVLTGDQCVTNATYNPENTCPNGYILSNGRCSKTVTTGINYSCPSGHTLSNGTCRKEWDSCRYDNKNRVLYHYASNYNPKTKSQYFWNGKLIGTISGKSGNWQWFGGQRYKIRHLKAPFVIPKPTGGAVRVGDVYEICKKEISTTSPIKKCPNGYTISGNQCRKTTTINATPACKNGGSLSADKTQCEYSSYVAFQPTCPSDYQLNDDKSLCYKDPTTKPVEGYQCPSLYPIWNESEQRCMTTLSPINKAQHQEAKSSIKTAETKQLVDEILKPFGFLLDSIVPTAHANETANGQAVQERVVTKESMLNYISGKFGDLAKKQAQDREMVKIGQQQLRSVIASSGKQTRSLATRSNAGTQNVTCQLFKGEAAECKIAVGGMQNCCESPVQTSLADYIKLTRTVLAMDGMTGEIFGLDGYAGVWKTASDWAVDGAWDTVQGLFSSSADVVTNTASEAAKDGVVDELMNQVSQEIMKYTYDFITQTFGEETAKMFIQKAGAQEVAAGAAEYAGSAAMQTIGSALMVVYYAYLAYVVFNLLVSIIYKCEEKELELATKVELLSTHRIGSYCKSKVLGMCIEKRNVHCKFDSPLSRIVMEQVYMQQQMGLSWGSPKSPNCKGLAIEDFAKIDWDKVNLDEWTAILIKTGNFQENMNVDVDSLTGRGSVLNTGGRQNVIERNKERAENIDLDQVRRDAYEDAWNQLQPDQPEKQ